MKVSTKEVPWTALLQGLAMEPLFDRLNALGRDVGIRIKKKSPRTQREAHVAVIVAYPPQKVTPGSPRWG